MVGVFCVLTSSDKTPFFFSSAVLHRVFAKVIRIANRVVLSISKFFFCQWKILQELIYLTSLLSHNTHLPAWRRRPNIAARTDG